MLIADAVEDIHGSRRQDRDTQDYRDPDDFTSDSPSPSGVR